MTYVHLTEIPDEQIPIEQLQRVEQRYSFSSKFTKNKDVLEIGCGPGLGSKLILENAKSYLGIDIDHDLINIAKQNNPKTEFIASNVVNFFSNNDNKYDFIIIYEAIYYIEDLQKLFLEIYDNLRNDGQLLICTANKNLLDFNPSPKTYIYPDIQSINLMCKNNFKIIGSYGGIKLDNVGIRQKILRPIKFLASKMSLIPKSMKNKKLLKKFFYGNRFVVMPKSISYNSNIVSEINIIDKDITDTKHKVLYFLLKKK